MPCIADYIRSGYEQDLSNMEAIDAADLMDDHAAPYYGNTRRAAARYHFGIHPWHLHRH